MKIITKYLGTTIITYILLVILLLFGLQAFIEFIHEFPSIGTGSYGIFRVLEYVALMLPSDVYLFFPMASLLGCTIALGLLASHSELIVIRAAGMSLVDITKDVAKATAILIVIMFIIGELLGPAAQKIAIRHKTSALSGGQALATPHGMWIRSGNNFVGIDSVANNNELIGITRYEFDQEGKLKAASHAERGLYQNNKWTFNNVVVTTLLNVHLLF